MHNSTFLSLISEKKTVPHSLPEKLNEIINGKQLAHHKDLVMSVDYCSYYFLFLLLK